MRLKSDPERKLYFRLNHNPIYFYDYFINKDAHAQPTWSEKCKPNYERDDIPLDAHTVPVLDLRTKLVKIVVAGDCIPESA